MSDYWKKKMDELEKETKKSPSQSYWDRKRAELEEEKKRKTGGRSFQKDEDEDDIAPVKSSKDDGKLDFFQKSSLFDDGWDFGDITKTILGSTGDAAVNAVKGVGGLVEGLTDLASYGVAGVADAIGKDSFADDLRKKTQESYVDKLMKPAEDYLDKYSVLGRTSDAILQGVGQVGGILATGGLGAAAGMGTAGATALTTGVMGLSGMGSGMGEAYQGGATDEEATLYGAISGTADALTELLFGGLGKAVNAVGLSKGLSSADDMLAKKVSSMFSKQIMKNFSEFGIKAGAEGFEEVLAGIAQAVGKKATYMSEEEFSKILQDENLLELFVVGTVTSGIAQTPGLHIANKTGSDFITGLNQNEQAVVKKEIENRIAEAEADGNKLSNTQKNKIYESIIQDLEKGYISTDLIDEVVGGFTYQAYKDSEAREDALQKEFDELGNVKVNDQTVAQQYRYKELSERIQSVKDGDIRKKRKVHLDQFVSEQVKGSRLAESYNEKARVYEDFKADMKQYEGSKHFDAAKQTIESAIKVGANNTNRVHDLVDMAAKTAADTGVVFRFKKGEQIKQEFIERQNNEIAKLEKLENPTAEQVEKLSNLREIVQQVESGEITVNGNNSDGVIDLNLDSPKLLNRTVGHEITHSFEPSKGKASKGYDALKSSLFAYAETKGVDIQSEIAKRKLMYEGIANSDPEAELVADLVGDYLFNDIDYVRTLSVENRNVFQRIYDEIKHLLKLATAGSKEARQLEQVKRNMEKVYREGANAQTEVKHSLSDTNGRQLSSEQQEFFKDSAVRDEDGNLKVMYHGTSRGGFNVFDTYGSNYGLFGTGSYFTDSKTIGESYTKKGKGKNPQVYEAYLNIKHPMDMDAAADPAEWAKAFPDADFPESGTNEQFYRAVEEFYADQWMSKWEVAEEIQAGIESNMGYDGITHIGGGRFNQKDDTRHRVYIAFQPEQIKNVDNAKPTSDPDIRYSLSDKDYMNAVNRGDMETAQKMAYEAAEKAGYTTDSSWKMQHSAPNSKDDISLVNLKESGLVPDDYWDHPGWYTYSPEERESFYKVKKAIETQEKRTAEGNPRDARMWVYRAVDKTKNVREEFFRNGDWVTPSEAYARNEGRMNPKGYRIIRALVPIKDLYWDGNSIAELGYDDGKTYAYADTANNRKLLDPVTYDDAGNVIPLSKRFKRRNWETRYSLSEDSDGNKLTEEQERYFRSSKMRDDNGNLKPMYHGTTDGGFHAFDTDYSDDGTSLFFVDSNTVAESYSGTSETYAAQTFKTAEDFNNFFAEIGAEEYEVREKDGKFQLYEDGDFAAESDTAKGIYEEFRYWSGLGEGAVNYKVYLDLVNPLEVDAKGKRWDELPGVAEDQYEYVKVLEVGKDTVKVEYAMKGDPAPVTEDVNLHEKFSHSLAETLSNMAPGEMVEGAEANPATTRDYAKYARENGYDGVIFKNIVDIGAYGGTSRQSTVAIAFDGSQVKSVANQKPTTNKDIRYSLSEDGGDIAQRINESMTMQEAKQMIQRAFVLGDIKNWYKGKYRNGDEWLKGEGVSDVAVIVDNEWSLQEKYLNKIQGVMDGDFYAEDILAAYLAGTLTGKKKQDQTQRLDLTKGSAALDERFYAPKQIEDAKATYEIASQKVTSKNRDAVYKARSDVIMYAHNRGAAETLGLTQAELNKKLSQWARYSAKAKEISQRFNAGVADWNKWTGIENSNILNKATVKTEDLERLVGTITGDNEGYQRKYIMRTMLALDTHIDYTGLNFKFVGVPDPKSRNTNGLYSNAERTITVKYDAPNTVAHEMGHFLDYQWARDVGVGGALTERFGRGNITDPEVKQWVTNFDNFKEKLEDVSDIGSGYAMDSKEVFARFVDKFVRWVNFAANKEYNNNTFDRNDKFTAQHYIEFVRLLQEKSAIDAKRQSNGNFSLSEEGAGFTPVGRNEIYGKDLLRQDAPVQEEIAPTVSETESVAPVVTSNLETATEESSVAEMFPDDLAPVESELDKLYQQKETLESRIVEAVNSEDMDAFTQANTEYDSVMSRIEELENEISETENARVGSLDDADAPPEMEAPYPGEASEPMEPADPFADRDMFEVGKRSVKAYQYENPEVKPFFTEAALGMLDDLHRGTKGEKIFNGDVYYQSGGEKGWDGTKRSTTADIAALLDEWHYTYAEIEAGLNAIIEDDGKENNAVSKRIEFMLDDRLRNGYTDVWGEPMPANQEYINLLNEKQITEYSREAFDSLFAQSDKYAPYSAEDDIAPVAESVYTPTLTQKVPKRKEKAYESIRPKPEKKTQPAILDDDIAPVFGDKLVRIDSNNGRPGEKQRKWVGTSTESEAVNRQVLPDDLDQDKIYYQPISNRVTLNKANVKLDGMGYESSVTYFNSQFTNKRVSLEDVALGERLIQEAIKRGDTKTAGELIQNVAILGTELGQKVQALSMIQRMTPEGQLKMLQKTVKRGQAKGDKAYDGVVITQEMIDKILSAYGKDGSYDQAYLDEMVEDVKKKIADQMKVTAMDKVNAWRYLSMLGNPKTHIRNLVSNVAMRGTVAVKNALARTIESVAPIQSRTKTWAKPTEYVQSYAQKTAAEMKDIISDGGKYSEDSSIKQKRDIFKNRILNGLYEFNSDMLTKEDWWFSKTAFTKALSEYLTANGIHTHEDLTKNPKIVEKARVYATEQSQIATFRQYSWLANKINDIERHNAATNIAVGAIMPFKKTPINIAKTGLNYSPLGFAKTLTSDVSKVKNGEMEASELVDHLAQNITGSALTLVGYMLASSGFLSGAGEDDKEGEYDYQLGQQAYAINIGGKSYSLSWLSPIAMPLFVGANAYEQLVEGKEWNGDVVVETLAQTLDPLSEMSFLSGLDSVLSSYESGIQKFAGIGQTMVQNYATQFVPTLSSQVATVLDDTKRSTKIGADSDFKFVDQTINKLKYKIPFLRETLEPSTDIWGNDVKQTENVISRAVETFLAPYAAKERTLSAVDMEIKALYWETGEDSIIPGIPNNSVTYKDQKYKMSADEYTAFKQTYGQTAFGLLEELFRTDTYLNATASDKADMVGKVYDYARDVAKQEFLAKKNVQYTNATSEGQGIYKEDAIRGAIEADMPVDEYTFSVKYPEKYALLEQMGINYDTYRSADEDAKDAYNWALENPDKYPMSKAVARNVVEYRQYTSALYDIKADKDASGKSISGSRKEKVLAYINGLDIDYGAKLILFKNEYNADDESNYEIIDYLNSRDDISFEEEVAILRELGFTVASDGTIYWD